MTDDARGRRLDRAGERVSITWDRLLAHEARLLRAERLCVDAGLMTPEDLEQEIDQSRRFWDEILASLSPAEREGLGEQLERILGRWRP